MFEFVTEKNLLEYEQFVQSHPKGHFIQSHMWAAVKSSWKWEGIIARDGQGKVIGALGVLIRKIGVSNMMYAGRGPVCDPHDETALRELTQGAAALAKKYKAYTLQLDPDISSQDERFIEIMKSLGYTHKPGDKNFDGVQPNFVFRLNVKDKTEDELMAAFHQKTRYNLRLSYRKGVTVKICGEEMLHDFAVLMSQTGVRDGFITRPESYFRTLLESFGDHARLYMAFWEDKPISGAIAIHYGNKVWYLYGASSNEHRNVMPNYQVQWEMIRWALEEKCDIYDFRGVTGDLRPENPLYGLYLFKKGFSGDLVEFCGQLEMIYKPFTEKTVRKAMAFARSARHKLAIVKNKLLHK